MLIDGVASAATVTCAANDQVLVKSVSTTQFKLSRIKYDGTAQVAASGAMVLLSTVTASNSATVDIETTFSSTYDTYLLVASGIRPSSAPINLLARLKIAGVYITSTTYFSHSNVSKSSAATYAGNADAAATSFLVLSDMHNAWIEETGSAFMMTISGPTATATHGYKPISWFGANESYNGGTLLRVSMAHGAAYNVTGGAITGVRFLMSTGNIAVGTFRLYGIANS